MSYNRGKNFHKKGKLKTTMSDSIMNKIADLIEKDLTDKGIFYLRKGTKFNLLESQMEELYKSQEKANLKLISTGEITMDMVSKDLKNLIKYLKNE